MTSAGRTGETLKTAVDLSLQYYSGLIGLSTSYLRSLGTLLTKDDPVATAPTAPTSPAAPSPPLLLFGRLGDEATASFLVENTLKQQVTARFVVRATGPAAALAVLPETAALAPGEQCIVQARVTVAPDMAVGEDYAGELAVPELASRTIPFVIRRIAGPKDEE